MRAPAALQLPDAGISDPVRIRIRDQQDRERLIREAADKHYQDQPYLTAGTLGSALGALAGGVVAPALTGYINGTPMYGTPQDRQRAIGLGVAGVAVGGAAGVSNEILGRLLTRAVGPRFRTARWAHDQDPHRWNTALRSVPVGLSLLTSKFLLPSIMHKQASIPPVTIMQHTPTTLAFLFCKAAFAELAPFVTQLGLPNTEATIQPVLSRLGLPSTEAATRALASDALNASDGHIDPYLKHGLPTALVHGLVGALGGGAAGALTNAARGAFTKDDKDDPSILGGALTGAAVGGAGGAGHGYARGTGTLNFLAKLLREIPPVTRDQMRMQMHTNR